MRVSSGFLSEPVVAVKQVPQLLYKGLSKSSLWLLNIKAFFPLPLKTRECYFEKNCSGISKNVSKWTFRPPFLPLRGPTGGEGAAV